MCVWGALRMIRRQVARGRLEQQISNPTSPALRRMSSVSPQRGSKRKKKHDCTGLLAGAPFLVSVERAGSGIGDAKEKNECSTTRNVFPANSSLPLFLAKQRCGSHGRHAPACLFMQRQRQGHRSGDKRALPCREGGQRGLKPLLDVFCLSLSAPFQGSGARGSRLLHQLTALGRSAAARSSRDVCVCV